MKFVFFKTLLVIALTRGVFGTTNYHTEDGIERHEEQDAEGTLKGHYSYTDPNGKRVLVNYVAGKDGFRATGNHFAQFNLGNTHLANDDSGVYTSSAEDSHSYPSYTVHKEVPSFKTHKEVASYTPKHETHSSYKTHKELPSYSLSHDETPVIRHEYQKPKSKPEYRPEPAVHSYKPEIHETYETHANLKNAQNEHAVSFVNHEQEDHTSEDDDDDEEEEEHSYDAHTYSTFRPPTSKPYFHSTKAPTYQPTFKPYYHEDKSVTEHNPITTKFSIKHPAIGNHNTESFSIPSEHNLHTEHNLHPEHKFEPSTFGEFPDVKTKTTYHTITEDSHYNNPIFESGDHLTDFDTTKFLNDYHNNKPSLSKHPHFPTTKFTIEDASAPSHGNAYLPKPSKVPEYSLTKFNEFKPENFKQPDFSNFFKTETSYTINDLPKAKPQEDDLSHLQFLNAKNPANLGQYQQYLKATEDEQIEQQFIRDQLKYKQQPNLHYQQRKRPSYSRPTINSFHPGRRPPKRPSTSPGLGTFRTTYKIPYGFNL